MNDFNKHVKSDTIKWVVVFTLLIVLMAGMVASILLALPEGEVADEEPLDEKPAEVTADVSAEIFNSERVSLAMAAEAMPLAADGATFTKTLYASVLPSTAQNQKVDWTVAWADGSTDADVEEYITVTPSADGSTTATLTCYQPFSKDIIVVVTTREGGFKASCVCKYSGIAKTMNIASSSMSSAGTDTYNIGTSYTGTITFDLKGSFGEAASTKLSYTTGAEGSLYFGKLVSSRATGSFVNTWSDVTLKDLDGYFSKFITSVSLSGTTLTIKTGFHSPSTYYEKSTYEQWGPTWTYTDRVVTSSYSASNVTSQISANEKAFDSCYFWVKVTDSNSGLNKTIKLKFSDNVVTGVSVSPETITI